MIRSILDSQDMRLHQPAPRVESLPGVSSIIQDLWDTHDALRAASRWRSHSGLSAPQIGEAVRICVVQFNDVRHTIINPQITRQTEDEQVVQESCHSHLNGRRWVMRAAQLDVTYVTPEAQQIRIRVGCPEASVILHAVDHLDGVMYDSRQAAGTDSAPVDVAPPPLTGV